MPERRWAAGAALALGAVSLCCINSRRVAARNPRHNLVLALLLAQNAAELGAPRAAGPRARRAAVQLCHFLLTLLVQRRDRRPARHVLWNLCVLALGAVAAGAEVQYYLPNVAWCVADRVRFGQDSVAVAAALVANAYSRPLGLAAFAAVSAARCALGGAVAAPPARPHNEVLSLLGQYGLGALRHETELERFGREQERLYREFMARLRPECGPQGRDMLEVPDHAQLYRQCRPPQNELFRAAADRELFRLRPNPAVTDADCGQYRACAARAAQQNGLALADAQLDALVRLYRHSVYPGMSVASLRLLARNGSLGAVADGGVLLSALAVVSTLTAVHSGFDDHYVVQVQHYFSMVFNDRSPNARAALAAGLQLIRRECPELLRLPGFRENYALLMLAGDVKQHQHYVRRHAAGEPGAALLLLGQLLRNSFIMRPGAVERMAEHQRRAGAAFGFSEADFGATARQFRARMRRVCRLLRLECDDE